MQELQKLVPLLEAILLVANKPLTEKELLELFHEEERPNLNEIRQALTELQAACADRGIVLVEVASGYRYQVKPEWAPWVSRLWEEKTVKYSRALLETLALIAYRQPITRGEIEAIRGVTVSSSIIKTLQEEREWIRVVGHKDVPGRPALYATTQEFLDYFGLKKLDQLPLLPDIPMEKFKLENENHEIQENLEIQITENTSEANVETTIEETSLIEDAVISELADDRNHTEAETREFTE